MAVAQLPEPLDVAKALAGILGKDIKAMRRKDAGGVVVATSFVGRYDDGAGNLEALVVMDLPLAASLGAALSLIPGGVAKDAIKDKKLESDMLDNAYEVTNILANSFVGKRVRRFVAGEKSVERRQDVALCNRRIYPTKLICYVEGSPI